METAHMVSITVPWAPMWLGRDADTSRTWKKIKGRIGRQQVTLTTRSKAEIIIPMLQNKNYDTFLNPPKMHFTSPKAHAILAQVTWCHCQTKTSYSFAVSVRLYLTSKKIFRINRSHCLLCNGSPLQNFKIFLILYFTRGSLMFSFPL